MCDNTRIYYVARGYSHSEVAVKCGTTDPYGGRCLCEACENDPNKLAEHERILANAEADNAWLRSAGWGER